MFNCFDQSGFLSSATDWEPDYYPALREQRYTVAIALLKQAFAQDNGHAMGIYGGLLALGRGIERNPGEAALWFRQSAVRGDSFGQVSFGLCLIIGFGVAVDYQEAAFWLCRAAREGNRRAMEVIADLVLIDPRLVGSCIQPEELDRWIALLPRRISKH